jgi:hypothetical protein
VGGSSLLSIELWRSKEKERQGFCMEEEVVGPGGIAILPYICMSNGNGGSVSEAPCGTGFARLLEWLPCRQVAYARVCVSLSLILTLLEFGDFLFIFYYFYFKI